MRKDDAARSNAADPAREPVLPPRKLSPAAQRALAEAAERHRLKKEKPRAAEIGGRDGPDPARYGDWEVKGIASDF